MWLFKSKQVLMIEQEGVVAGRHVSLRPTRLGIGLLTCALGIWLGAANYQVNVAYLICFWLVCFVFVAALLTRRQLLGLHLQIDYHDEVFVGQDAKVCVYTRGSGKRMRLFWYRSELDYDISEADTHQFSAWQKCQISDKFNQNPVLNWSITTLQRGYFHDPLLLRLATSAPFGLFSAECLIQWQTQAVVYPAPLEHSDFGTQDSSKREKSSWQVGMHGEDIAYLKSHLEGNSLQHVAWKVYAKRGELMDKVFEEPPPLKQNRIISYADYPYGTPLDKLASLLTYRVLQAEQLGVPYVLQLPQLSIEPQNQQREKCLNALALM